MTDQITYCVLRRKGGGETTVASGIDTMAEAAEIAVRLIVLQEYELGGDADFTAMAE